MKTPDFMDAKQGPGMMTERLGQGKEILVLWYSSLTQYLALILVLDPLFGPGAEAPSPCVVQSSLGALAPRASAARWLGSRLYQARRLRSTLPLAKRRPLVPVMLD